MRKYFIDSLYLKIGILIVLSEIIILSLVSFIYYSRFAEQIDLRTEERIRLSGELIANSLIRIASLRNKEAIQLLMGETVVDVLLIDTSGQISFSLNTELNSQNIQTVESLDANWFNFEEAQRRFEKIIDNNQSYIISVTPILSPTGEFEYYIYIKNNVNSADTEKIQVLRLLLLGSLLTVTVTFIAIFITFHLSIFSRLQTTLNVLSSIQNGNLAARVNNQNSNDEIGVLQNRVNLMAARREESEKSILRLNEELNRLNRDLELRVANRTHELEVAADVAKRITEVLELNKLLSEVVRLTNDGFKLYSTTIFLFDDANQVLTKVVDSQINNLESSDGDVVLSIATEPSIVAFTARERKTTLVNDITNNSTYKFDKSLPKTAAELAIPLLIGDKLLGVFDLQAEQKDYFRVDEVRVLTTLAEQISITVRNAQLFEGIQTARKEAELANHVKSQFLANMSHELRTPLNAVINLTQIVTLGIMGEINEEQKKALDTVVASGRHLLALINDVLDISKIESGSLKLFVEEAIDIKAELYQVAQTAESLVRDKPVEIIIDFPDLPLIKGDRRRILQIMLNLASNACKFTTTGSITISAKKQADTVLLAVQDTGPGIASKDQEVIFEIFQQTEAGLKSGTGTGLGLPISRRLAEAHGGKLWLESTLGVGSTFFVQLPIDCDILVPTIAKK